MPADFSLPLYPQILLRNVQVVPVGGVPAPDGAVDVRMQGGRIVAERYGAGYNRDTRFAGWSMTKTITAVMIGMLISDGRMQLDESAPIPL